MAMNLGKTLAITAVGGVLAGLAGCGGAAANAADPKMATAGAKECCKGKNACHGQGNCAVEGKQKCAGQNKCAGQGGEKSGPGCAKDGAGALPADAPAAAPAAK